MSEQKRFRKHYKHYLLGPEGLITIGLDDGHTPGDRQVYLYSEISGIDIPLELFLDAVKGLQEYLADEAAEQEQSPQKVYWTGEAPKVCQLCGSEFASGDHFVDGKTAFGPWAIMCTDCHASNGHGLGTGRGQEYSWDTLAKTDG